MRLIGRLSVIAVFSLCFQASFAQKLVDPNAVAPEYREAAAKRRAEQIRQFECAHKADAWKVTVRLFLISRAEFGKSERSRSLPFVN